MATIQDQLYKLIEDDVIPDIEEYIDELFEKIAAKKESAEDKEILKEMQEMHMEFNELLDEIKAGEIDDEEANELLEEIIDMRKEED
jgi:hypothetical protein